MQKIALSVIAALVISSIQVFGQEPTLRRWGGRLSDAALTPASACAAASVSREAARLAKVQSPTPATSPTPPEQSWAGQHPVLLGTLLGLAGGSAVGLSSPDCRSTGGEAWCGVAVGGWAGIGAGIGAATGWVVSMVRK